MHLYIYICILKPINDSNKHANLAIIDQLTNNSKSKETLTQHLIERENFCKY